MSEKSFLAHFIEDPIYVIPEKKDGAYKVEESVEQPEAVEEPEAIYVKPLPTEGDNLKHCIVLIKSDTSGLSEELKSFLFKILAAVKRSPEDVLIANVKDASDEQIEALLADNNHRHLLAFGCQMPNHVSIQNHYEVVKDAGKSYLLSHELEAVQGDLDKKKALWKVLQEMFL